jgi:hypothetical protein
MGRLEGWQWGLRGDAADAPVAAVLDGIVDDVEDSLWATPERSRPWTFCHSGLP